MNPFVPQPESRVTPEPLPVEFDAEHRRVDELLAQSAHSTPVPMGLSERVFEASVSGLPSAQPALRLVGTQAEPRHAALVLRRRLTWSRLAAAASIALAFGVGALMFKTSPKPSATFEVATLDSAPRASSTPTASEAVAIAMSEVNGLPAGAIDQLDRQMSYLLETRDVTSMNDVRGELLMLVAAMEM